MNSLVQKLKGGAPDQSARAWQPASQATILTATALCFAAVLILDWPGSLSFVPIEQWYDARAGIISQSYAPLMSFVWRWLDMICPGPGLMLALELLTFWAAIAWLLIAARPGPIGIAVGIVLLGVTPFAIGFSSTLLTDVFAGNLALLGWVLLLSYPRFSARTTILVLAFCLFGLAGMMRYQMWSVALPALGGIVAVHWGRSRASAGRMLRVATFSLGVLLFSILAVQAALHLTFKQRASFVDANLRYSMLYDIAAVIARDSQVPLQGFAAHGIDVDGVRSRARQDYSPYNGDSLGMAPGGNSAGRLYELVAGLSDQELAQEWREVVAAAPAAFLMSRVERLRDFLGLGTIYRCTPLDVVGFSGTPANKWAALDKPALKEAYVTPILRWRYFPADTFLFRPVTYLILSFVVLGLVLYTRPIETPLLCAMIAAAWTYWMTFLPLPVSCEVRYSYFSCTAVVFAGVFWCLHWFGGRDGQEECCIGPA